MSTQTLRLEGRQSASSLTLVFPLGHTPGRVGMKRKFQFADIANEIVRKISDLLVLSCELQHFLARFVM